MLLTMLSSLLYLGVFSLIYAQEAPTNGELSSGSRIISQFKRHRVIPEVVDTFSPQGVLSIEYGRGGQRVPVNLGNSLSLGATQNAPTMQFIPNRVDFPVKERDRFVLAMTDADAPSTTDRSLSEYCHWVVSDVRLTRSRSSRSRGLSLDLSAANELVPYLGPGPPPNSGRHRYVFVLYRQDPRARLVAPPGRPRWGTQVAGSGVREWIRQYGRSEVLSGNFFLARNEGEAELEV